MAYDKPKVTIDLDEYQELLKKSETTEDDKLLMMRHLTYLLVSQLYQSGGGINQLRDVIREMEGIGIQVNLGGNNTRLHPDDISLTRIKK